MLQRLCELRSNGKASKLQGTQLVLLLCCTVALTSCVVATVVGCGVGRMGELGAGVKKTTNTAMPSGVLRLGSALAGVVLLARVSVQPMWAWTAAVMQLPV